MGAVLRKLAFVVALIVGGPTLFVWAMSAIIGLYVLGLAVEVVQFVVTHAVAAVGLSLLGAGAFLWGMSWRPRAKTMVAATLLYAVMAFRLFGGWLTRRHAKARVAGNQPVKLLRLQRHQKSECPYLRLRGSHLCPCR